MPTGWLNIYLPSADYTNSMAQRALGEVLLPLLEGQMDHESRVDLIRRNRMTDVRDICGPCYDSVCWCYADSGFR